MKKCCKECKHLRYDSFCTEKKRHISEEHISLMSCAKYIRLLPSENLGKDKQNDGGEQLTLI